MKYNLRSTDHSTSFPAGGPVLRTFHMPISCPKVPNVEIAVFAFKKGKVLSCLNVFFDFFFLYKIN